MSLLAAVSDRPGDLPLRRHVARLMLERGRPAEAVQQCSAVLALEPVDPEAIALLAAASVVLSGGSTGGTAPAEPAPLVPALGDRGRPGRRAAVPGLALAAGATPAARLLP